MFLCGFFPRPFYRISKQRRITRVIFVGNWIVPFSSPVIKHNNSFSAFSKLLREQDRNTRGMQCHQWRGRREGRGGGRRRRGRKSRENEIPLIEDVICERVSDMAYQLGSTMTARFLLFLLIAKCVCDEGLSHITTGIFGSNTQSQYSKKVHM